MTFTGHKDLALWSQVSPDVSLHLMIIDGHNAQFRHCRIGRIVLKGK